MVIYFQTHCTQNKHLTTETLLHHPVTIALCQLKWEYPFPVAETVSDLQRASNQPTKKKTRNKQTHSQQLCYSRLKQKQPTKHAWLHTPPLLEQKNQSNLLFGKLGVWTRRQEFSVYREVSLTGQHSLGMTYFSPLCTASSQRSLTSTAGRNS